MTVMATAFTKEADALALAFGIRQMDAGKVYEADALALAFGIRQMDAGKVYALLKDADKLPENYIMGSRMKRSIKNGLKLRLSKKSWKGYLLAGTSLLLFSLISVFPVYYIAAGGLLLAAAVLVRVFGKA